MKQLILVVIALLLSSCKSWEWQEPIPQYAIESCLQAHGRPISDGIGNESHIRCEFQRNLDARYFDDSRLLDPHFNTGDVPYNGDSKYVIVPIDDYFNKSDGVVIRPYEGFSRDR